MKRVPNLNGAVEPDDAPSGGAQQLAHARTIERACAVMSSFSLEEPRLALAALAEHVALPKPTVHRIASSLVAAGFMSQFEDGRYGLGPALLELGGLVRHQLDVVSACASAVDAIGEATGETVLLGVADWQALEMVIVACRATTHPLGVSSPLGRRSDMPPGALGKALLLGLEPADAEAVIGRMSLTQSTAKTHTDRAEFAREVAAARAVGYAIAVDEYLDDVSGVAVPVMSDAGRPVATLGVVGPSSRMHGNLERFGLLARELTAHLRPLSSQGRVGT